MDRQEAIQTLSKVGKISVSYAEDLYDSFFQKPVVPQYVADWYEEHKDELEYDIWLYFTTWKEHDEGDFKKWLGDCRNNPIQTLVDMHRLGYTVEKEPRYTVRVKGITGYNKYLNQDIKTQKWIFASKSDLERFRTHHTRKELEDADFGWVFDCPGVEVKEVEDGND